MSAAVGPSESRRRSWSSWKVDLLLGLAVLALTAPFLREWSTQPASRYLFTAALVDDGTLRLDPYKDSLGQDYAVIDGHVYSDKAPYQPVLAAPVYWLYRQAGGEAIPAGLPANQVGHRFDIGLWLVTLWSSVLPAVLLALLIKHHVARFVPRDAVAVSLALMFGTVLLPFGALLFGHELAAMVGFASWYLLRRDSPSALALFGAGLLMGAGLGIEYPQVVVAAVLGVYAIVAFKRRVVWVVAGGVVGALPLLVFNTITFGGPMKTAYQGYLPNFQGSGAFGVYNLVAPDPQQFMLAIVGDRGLFSLTPIMIMAAIGAVTAIRKRDRTRPDGIVALTLLGLFLLVSTGIDGYGGSSPGPRYLVPILPFFAVPLAVAWQRWRGACIALAVFSAVWMILATVTDSLYSDGGQARLDWLKDLFGGRFEHSIPGELIADPAVLVMVPIAIACAWGALRIEAREKDRRRIGKSRDTPTEAAPG